MTKTTYPRRLYSSSSSVWALAILRVGPMRPPSHFRSQALLTPRLIDRLFEDLRRRRLGCVHPHLADD
jgi:hypothetical protein